MLLNAFQNILTVVTRPELESEHSTDTDLFFNWGRLVSSILADGLPVNR